MRQMMRADEKITAGDRHVLSQLPLDREVRLVRVRVFKSLADMQRKRQHWSKARERLIVEALATSLILSGGRGARCAVHSRNSAHEITDDDGALENLRRIQQCRRRRSTLRG